MATSSVLSMYGEHGFDLVEGERNGVPVLVWMCICGARGKGTGSMRQAVTGWRKHAGVPATPSKPRQQLRTSPDW